MDRIGDVLDIVASRVTGLMTAKDVRVVWHEGWLYVCKSPTDIAAFQCDEPKKKGGYYKTMIGVEALGMVPPGCGSCRKRVRESPVGQMSVEQIVAAANVMSDA